MSEETLKQIVEKLQGKASAHAKNGLNYDKDGFYDLANHEYAMIEAYDDAIKTVIQVVQAEPVRHGEWIKLDECDYQCSECGFRFTSADPISKFEYCRCGARMKGANDGWNN